MTRDLLFLPSATKLRQGNIFRSVCQEFCPQGGCLPRCMLGYTTPTPPWADTPLGRHPPGRHPPGRHPQADTLPQQTATAADATHPTGMYSCYLIYFQRCVSFKQQICALKWCTVNAIGWVALIVKTVLSYNA